MNYYDALLQHRNRIEEVERHQENARHLRDSQRTEHEHQDKNNEPKRPSAFLRLMSDVKAAVEALSLPGQKRVIHAGHPAAIKDLSC
jgi:hypothetical protein